MKNSHFHLLTIMSFLVSSLVQGMTSNHQLLSNEIQDSINVISSEYSARIGTGRITSFTTNISYMGIDGEAKDVSKYTCSLGVPETNELNELRKYLPKNGLPLSYDNFDNPAMEKLKEMYTDREVSCSKLRDMYSMVNKLIDLSREEENFISIIKNDVFCRMYTNGRIDRDYINEALELVRNAHSVDVRLRSNLFRYLENLWLNNDSNIRSSDEYENLIWRTLISNLSNDCHYEKSSEQSASEIAIKVQAMLGTLYSSCESGGMSLASIQCHKKAINFGGASLEKVMLLEEVLGSYH